MKQLTRGNHTFTYDTYFDDMGFERESFEIVETLEGGERVSRPFVGPFKITAITRDTPLGPLGYTRTDEELEQIFTDELARNLH